MSSERSITRAGEIEVSPEPTAEDIRLQINVRLKRDDLNVDLAPLRSRGANAPSHHQLCVLACQLYDARREREKILGPKMFGEPGWDMMLALYCLPARGERLGVTDLTIASGCPQTTALRWQTILMEDGLIERIEDPEDRRRSYVQLTTLGRERLEDYLLWLYHVEPHPVRKN